MNSTLPEAAVESAQKPRKKSAAAARREMDAEWRGRQYSLFSDDAAGAVAILDIADRAQSAIEAALEANPSILPFAAEQTEARSSLELARFMRSTGTPSQEVAETLREAGADADVVMRQLAAVELEVGDDYPEDSAEELPEEVTGNELDDDATGERSEDGAAKTISDTGGPDDASLSALGGLMKRIRGPRFAPLPVEEETALGLRVRSGDESAINQLADHNMRFLVAMAKRFRYTGRPLDELISAGTIGLLNAARKFDPAKGRFTTVAVHWIRQSIQRSMLSDSLMKTPAYMPTLETKLRRDAALETDDDARAKMVAKADSLKREIAARRSTHVSMDGATDDDSDGGGLHNMFADESLSVEDKLEQERLVEWLVRAANRELKTAAGKPDDRARDVFVLRLGLHKDHLGEPQTLAELSEKFGVSRERVRQIYNEAAIEVADAVEAYANGAENLPAGFRQGLLSQGKNASSAAGASSAATSAASSEQASDSASGADAAMSAIFAAEAAGPDEAQKRAQLVAWLVQAANRELKTDDGKRDDVSRDVFLMRVGLHSAHYGEPQSVVQVSRHMGIARESVRRLYCAAAEEIAYAVEHYAKRSDNLPTGFRKSLLSPGR